MAIGSNFYESTGGTRKYKVTNANIPATMYLQRDGVHSWQYAANGTAGNTITFTQAMTLSAAGNLGIGTTSPDSATRLDIEATNARVRVKATSTGSALYTTNNTGGTFYTGLDDSGGNTFGVGAYSGVVWNGANTPIVFATNNTERARITSAGEFLVGTTSYGSAANGWAFSPTGYSYTYRSGTSSQTHIDIKNGNGSVGAISTSGTTTTYATSSDYRLKENITPMTGALAKVAQLKPVTYKWKSDGLNSEGFIAHELAEVFPQAVVGEKDAVDTDGNPKYQGIDTSFLVATLTAAIQEQQAMIESLRQRLSAANL
jgi:hypothetical protein